MEINPLIIWNAFITLVAAPILYGIRKNEKEILKPFYKKCADLAGRDNVVFFEQVYVK